MEKEFLVRVETTPSIVAFVEEIYVYKRGGGKTGADGQWENAFVEYSKVESDGYAYTAKDHMTRMIYPNKADAVAWAENINSKQLKDA